MKPLLYIINTAGEPDALSELSKQWDKAMTAQDIKALRKKLGMNQRTFAAKLGTDQAHICKWETGKHKPGKFYIQIMKDLQVSLS